MTKKGYLSLFFCLLVSTNIFAQGYERTKIWDKDIDAFSEIDRLQSPPKDAVLFVGSSSVRLWKNLRESFPTRNVINRGFGGSYLAEVNYYFDRIVTPYKPKLIVLYAGENDINDGISPEAVAESYRKFSEVARKNFPKIKLIYISLKPSPSRWQKADEFRQVNRLIKATIGKDKRTIFVDVWSLMINEKGEPREELFSDDRLHMNEKGYSIWRDSLDKYLK